MAHRLRTIWIAVLAPLLLGVLYPLVRMIRSRARNGDITVGDEPGVLEQLMDAVGWEMLEHLGLGLVLAALAWAVVTSTSQWSARRPLGVLWLGLAIGVLGLLAAYGVARLTVGPGWSMVLVVGGLYSLSLLLGLQVMLSALPGRLLIPGRRRRVPAQDGEPEE